MVSGSALTSSSVGPFSSSATGMSTISARGSHSTPFALSLQRSVLGPIKMAIADLFHCKNIPDAVVELPRFMQLVRMCHLVGEEKIGGELLDLNHANIYQENKKELLKFAPVFGLTVWVMVQPSIECL